MGWLRPVGLLVLVCAAALFAAWLGRRPDETPMPAGSSYSAEPAGTKALYLWAEAAGARAERDLAVTPGASPDVIVVAEPELPFSPVEREVYAVIADSGGTVVIAGDTFPARSLARALDVTIEPTPIATTAGVPGTGTILATQARARVRADSATPLLLAANGDWLALSKPRQQGRVVVFATSFPLSNEGLRDPENARLVYRSVLAPAAGNGFAIDEVHHSHAAAVVEQAPGFDQVLFATAPGRAVVYAACLAFLYLLLAGRRLGPPLPYAAADRASRTMFEHVETLASLYRRGRQLPFLRDQYLQRYGRQLRRALHVDSPTTADPAPARQQLQLQLDLQERGLSGERADRLARAMGSVASARTESELLAAVTTLEGAIRDTPGLS